MKIIELRANNIKRLRAVTIRPDGHVVEISGRNGQGKTSVLDSIYWALASGRSHQEKPIREGEDNASIRLDLGDMIVTRTFRAVIVDDEQTGRVTTQLRVESAEGVGFRSPQAMLDKLLGSLSFDPLAFSRAQARVQYETLAGFVADIDVAEFDQEQEQDYDLRRVRNREAKEAKAAVEAVVIPDDAPTEPVSYEDLKRELRDAEATNRDRERWQRNLIQQRQGIEEHRTLIQHRRQELADLKRKALALKASIEDLEQGLEEKEEGLEQAQPIPARADTDAILSRMEAAADRNAAFEVRAKRKALEEAALEAEKKAKAVDVRMTNRKAAFEAAVAAADMPVVGLTLEGGAVLLNGVPLQQASDAEQLRLSCACAMRQNSELRVLRVRDGSLLDSESMKVLREMADAHDYQVWIERVADAGEGVGFVIEDGSLVEEEA